MDSTEQRLEVRIDWSEVDAFGHVNNLAILKYAQAARVHFLDAIGLMQSQAEEGVGPILASINGQFFKPLFFPGNVTVLSKVTEIKNTSFVMLHQIRDEVNEIAAEVRDVIVYYDFRTEKKKPIPEDLKESLQETRL